MPEPLPFVDEHVQWVDAHPDKVWASLVKFFRRQSAGNARIAKILGCVPVSGSADFAGRPGETVPGFRVVEAEPGRRLALQGRHRFAIYALTFVVEGNCLRAQTHALFPGFLGRMYRAAVIGSGAHRLVTKAMLRQVARRA